MTGPAARPGAPHAPRAASRPQPQAGRPRERAGPSLRRRHLGGPGMWGCSARRGSPEGARARRTHRTALLTRGAHAAPRRQPRGSGAGPVIPAGRTGLASLPDLPPAVGAAPPTHEIPARKRRLLGMVRRCRPRASPAWLTCGHPPLEDASRPLRSSRVGGSCSSGHTSALSAPRQVTSVPAIRFARFW
ncbi:uncharacterized protein LOC121471442 isoform X2 [Vulpes lagopus]|uniref:uncharacterized protein LOC121471442 isoform X2 n=1 Tax=Vulpes lagopus TaxID=494514 RepID=UPI001BC92394|nr:uncharacterized protein LOC121471442 isoform X2 [Vulpes lagopus]